MGDCCTNVTGTLLGALRQALSAAVGQRLLCHGSGQNPVLVPSGGNRIYGDDERDDRGGYGGCCETRGERVLSYHGTRICVSVPAGPYIVSECGKGTDR